MAGKSAKYYASNPAARKKKNEYQKKYNATKEERDHRNRCNKARRKAKAKGVNIAGKDYQEKGPNKGKFVSVKSNRGRAGEGGRKKGKRK